MNELEEKTIGALKTLFNLVDILQGISIRDVLRPEVYRHYEKTLQAAYDALTQVEHAISGLGMKLEYQHWRVGGAMEELNFLLQQTHIRSDELTTLLG